MPGEPSQQSTWELVAAARPDVVVVMPCGYDAARAVVEAEEHAGAAAHAGRRARRRGRRVVVLLAARAAADRRPRAAGAHPAPRPRADPRPPRRWRWSSDGRRAPRTVLYLHSSAGRYGADRQLALLAGGLDPARYRPLVVLAMDGELREDLQAAGVEVLVRPLAVMRRAAMSPAGLAAIGGALARDGGGLARLARRRGVALIHTNTSVTLGGSAASRLARIPHVWHVREIYAGFERYWPAYSRLLLQRRRAAVRVAGDVRAVRRRPARAASSTTGSPGALARAARRARARRSACPRRRSSARSSGASRPGRGRTC